MSTVAEIIDAFPKLSTEELRQIERALISVYKQRREGIIFDDAYGVLTEEDQAFAMDEIFAADSRQNKANQT